MLPQKTPLNHDLSTTQYWSTQARQKRYMNCQNLQTEIKYLHTGFSFSDCSSWNILQAKFIRILESRRLVAPFFILDIDWSWNVFSFHIFQERSWVIDVYLLLCPGFCLEEHYLFLCLIFNFSLRDKWIIRRLSWIVSVALVCNKFLWVSSFKFHFYVNKISHCHKFIMH